MQQVQPHKPTHRMRMAALSLSAVLILLVLAAGELVLRRWFPFENAITQRDARYLYKYIPGARRLRPMSSGAGSTIMVTVNREGRLGTLVSKTSRPRIVVYGDSFIAGEETPNRQTFLADLERALQARLSKTAQVINAGVAGYGPDQESLVIEDEIDTLKPDLMIVAIFSGNDFGDLLRNKLYALDDREQLIALHPSLARSQAAEFAEAERKSSFQIVRRVKNVSEVVRKAALIQKLKRFLHVGHASEAPKPRPKANSADNLRWLLAAREQEYRNAVVERDPLVYNLLGDSWDLDISLHPSSPSARYKALLMRRIMERIQGIAARRKIPYAYLIIPASLDAADWDVAVDSSTYPEYRRSHLTDVLEQIARDGHMPYLNLFPAFYEHRGEDLFYHVVDDHWNPRGQQLAANLMADYIVNRRFE